MTDQVFAWTAGGQITLAEALQAPDVTAYHLAKFARSFASFISSKISIDECLARLRFESPNLRLKAIACMAYDSLKNGETIAEPLRRAIELKLHDSTPLAFLVDIGEEVGSLDVALNEYAAIADDLFVERDIKGGLALRLFVVGFWMMQDAGLPVLRSLRVLSSIHPNENWKRELGLAADRVEKGARLRQAFGEADFFPKVLVTTLGTGEDSGGLEVSLKNLLEELKQ